MFTEVKFVTESDKTGISIVQIPDNVIQYRFILQKYSCYTQSDRHSSFSPAPLILFMLDYIAVMGLFVAVGHYMSEILKKLQKRKLKT